MVGGSLVLGQMQETRDTGEVRVALAGVGVGDSIPLTCVNGTATGIDVTYYGPLSQIFTLTVLNNVTLNVSVGDPDGLICEELLRKP